MTLDLGFARAELPSWFASVDDFCGVEITFDANRQPVFRRCGGYRPRPMTKDELRPWVRMVRGWIEEERKGPEGE
jgi:hypothetical protein